MPHQPNRALARAKLETLAWEQTPDSRRGRSGSRREVLLDTTEGAGMVPLGELTDFQLRRYIGPGALEEAGDMRKNGRGIYHGTAAGNRDYVIHRHGTSGRYYVDRVGQGGTHTQIGSTRGCASVAECRVLIRDDAMIRAAMGPNAGVIFEQRGDELVEIGHTARPHEKNARPHGEPQPKFKLGDLVEDIDGTRKGRVEHIRGYDDLLHGYRYMVRDTSGSRLNWNETNMRLQRGHRKNARRPRDMRGIAEDPQLLQQFVEMAAESMELENWNDAEVTDEVEEVAAEYDEALKKALADLVEKYPPEDGSSAEDLWLANAAYLVLMTLRGEGVGIWDGDWDSFYADTSKAQDFLDSKLHRFADSSGSGKLNEAFMNAAYATCGEPEQTPNASRRREEPDEQAARELSLYIENEYSLVGAPNSQGKAIEKNLLKKIKNGTFDLALSEKAWMYLMETGAKKYCKEYASPGDWSKVFNKPTRELVAHEFATTFAAEHGAKSMTRNAHIETEEFDAPAHWASALINGDLTSFDDEEAAEFEAWCDKHPNLYVVDVSEETHIGRWNGLQTELATYTAHVQ